MSFKSTEHGFESGSDIIKILEFPFYPGEQTQGEFLPYNGYVKRISVMGNPKNEQTLFIETDDTFFYVKGNSNFVTQLEDAISKWKIQWEAPDSSVETKTEEVKE